MNNKILHKSLSYAKIILLAILPVMIVYMALSKFIIKGVTAGSVKG